MPISTGFALGSTVYDLGGGGSPDLLQFEVGGSPVSALGDADAPVLVAPRGLPLSLSGLSADLLLDGSSVGTVTAASLRAGTAVDLAGIGSGSLVAQISDGTTTLATAPVALTADAPPNEPPVATGDTATVVAGGSVQIDVLANDTDLDGDTLSVIEATASPAGTVTIGAAPDYLLTYDATGVPAGTEVSIFYTVSDGTDTDAGTVTVTVGSAAPVLSNLQTSGSPVETVTVEADADCTVYYRLSTTSGQDGETIVGGGGEAAGSFAAVAGSGGSVEIDLTEIAAGTYYLGVAARVGTGPISNVLEVEATLAEVGPSVSFIQSARVLNAGSRAASFTSDSFTIGSGPDRCLVALLHGFLYASQGTPVIDVSFGGQPMQIAIAENTVSGQKVWSAIAYLVNPPSGTGTLSVGCFAADGITPIDNNSLAAHLVELNGVDQATPVGATGADGPGDSDFVTTRAPSIEAQQGSMCLSALALEKGGLGSEITLEGAAEVSGAPGQAGTGGFVHVSFSAGRRLRSATGTEQHTYAWATGSRCLATIAEMKAAS